MEARVAKLEASVSHIERDITEIKVDIKELRKKSEDDFRKLFGAIIVATLGLASLMAGLAGIMAKGFKWF